MAFGSILTIRLALPISFFLYSFEILRIPSSQSLLLTVYSFPKSKFKIILSQLDINPKELIVTSTISLFSFHIFLFNKSHLSRYGVSLEILTSLLFLSHFSMSFFNFSISDGGTMKHFGILEISEKLFPQ